MYTHTKPRIKWSKRLMLWALLAALMIGAVPSYAQGPAQTLPRIDITALLQQTRNGPVRVIVELGLPFAPEPNLSAFGAVGQRLGIAAQQNSVLAGLVGANITLNTRYTSIPMLALTVDAAALNQLAARPEVIRIHEDRLNAAALDGTTGIVGARTAWNYGYDGRGQDIAIIDTGVDRNHPFLAGKVIDEACFSSNIGTTVTSLCPGGATSAFGTGAAADCAGPDGCGHGTHVAGIAAGRNGSFNGVNFDGVARAADILAVKVFSNINDMSVCVIDGVVRNPCVRYYDSDAISGLQHIFNNRANFNVAAVNMSLGGDVFTAYCTNTAFSPILANLEAANIAVVVSAGNKSYVNGVGSPACHSNVIAVGATDNFDNRADFSNYWAESNIVWAPGEAVLSSTGGTYGNKNGTSMAAPHVAGAIAIIRQARAQRNLIALTPLQMRNLLRDTGVQVFALSTNHKRISITNALQLDTTPPSAFIDWPPNYAAFNTRSVAIRANVYDNVGGIGICAGYLRLLRNGAYTTVATDKTAPFGFIWDTSQLADGVYRVAIQACDKAGNFTPDTSIRHIIVDRTPPTVTITSPTANTSVRGASVNFTANASDGGLTFLSGVCAAFFGIRENGQIRALAMDKQSPYGFMLDTRGLKGRRVLTAYACDKAGNWSPTAEITVRFKIFGPDTIGVWRPSNQNFYLRTTNTAGSPNFTTRFGLSTDIPVVGDWDGDGISTVGVFRASQGRFYLSNSPLTSASAALTHNVAFGLPGDLPVVGDWDGDGRDSIGVYRPSTKRFYLRNTLTSGAADSTITFGITGDTPLVGDFDADGKDTVAVWRGSTRIFYVSNTVCGACTATIAQSILFGVANDIPLIGDWDGDGSAGIGVWRPSNRIFYLRNPLIPGSPNLTFAYGVAGDKPLIGLWQAVPADEIPETAPSFVPR